MPEISLKAYFARLNQLLSTSAADEVIHHSRHILQYFPKNVEAYRYLGRALVMNGRWEEGREALRRVLSVIPDDYAAHLGLSEANERMNRPDEAIWHLERVLEQRPNDKDVIEGLRGLYRRYRQVENLKVQLTSAAVARQNVRSGDYAQAIDALRNALTRTKERLDLKLLLAQILWQHGSEDESADLALEVLKVLPDCLAANRIMAQLWLSVDRPSDARRYVNHLEAVDPYLAVELVQGELPDDDVFRLEELDYVRTSQSELTGDRPAWLQEISAGPIHEVEAANRDDWSNWASAMLSSKPPAAPSPTYAPPPSSEEPITTSGLTDLFGKPDDSQAEELSALFESGIPEEEDPMAWLHEAGVEIVDDEEPSFGNLFAADVEDESVPEAEEDPMAWLQSASPEVDLDAGEPQPEADSVAWMRDQVSMTAAQPDTLDGEPLDWLQDDQLLDEALGFEGLGDESPAEITAQHELPSLHHADELPEPPDETEPPAPQNVPGPRRGLTAILQEANFDWANQQSNEDAVVNDAELDDWLNQFGPAEPRKSVIDEPEWLTHLEETDRSSSEPDEWFAPEAEPPVPESDIDLLRIDDDDDHEDSDWLSEFVPEEVKPVADDDFTWLNEESLANAETEAAEAPDWLSELEPDSADKPPESAASDPDEFPWMNEDSEPESEEEPEAEAGEMPDWLSELEPEQAEEEAEAAVEPSADAEFAWMSEESLAEEPEAEIAAEDMPDWLSALAPEQAEEEAEAAVEPSADAEFAWMSEESLAEEPEAEIAAEDMPDWLSALAPEAELNPETEAEPTADAEFAWMTEDSQPEAEAEIEEEADAEPDWLSALEPEAELNPETEAEPTATMQSSRG